VPEDLVDEAIALRDRVIKLRDQLKIVHLESEQHTEASQEVAKSLEKLSRSLNVLMALGLSKDA